MADNSEGGLNYSHPLSELISAMGKMNRIPPEHRTKDWYYIQGEYVRTVLSWATVEAATLARESEYAPKATR